MLLLAKKEFLAGMMLALFAVATAVNIGSVYAVATQKSIPEVEFSQKLGLFDASRLSDKVLKSNISELAFHRALNVVLVKIGIVRKYNMSELVELGIVRDGATNGTISRQGAAKTILRAIVHGWYREALRRDGIKNINPFKDWKIEERYREPLTYAIQHNIFRGSADGKFNPNGKLKVREALSFLMRLYEDATGVRETSGAVFPASTQESGESIELLGKENEKEFAAQFERLKKAGAFDLTNFGGKIRGDSAVLTIDLGNMFLGILKNLNSPAYVSQVKYYAQTSTETYANRDLLACMATSLVEAIPHRVFDEKVVYSDVAPSCEVDYALNNLARAGIKMGYTDSMFKGYERISFYEAFGLVDKVLTEMQPPITKASMSMTTDEVEAWKQNLIKRKNRVRKILSH